MKTKWYLYTIVTILALLGVNQQQIPVPNQEIVVQFNNDKVTSDDIQNAIEIVKIQLLAIGIDNIQVGEEEDGRLKIAYHSNKDIASIKEILSKEKSLELGYANYSENQKHSKFPSDKDSSNYNLDVYEIQNSNDVDSGFDGFVLEQKTDNDRFSNPNVYTYTNRTDIRQRNKDEDIAYARNRNSAIAIENTLQKIPEVRAGPPSNGNS